MSFPHPPHSVILLLQSFFSSIAQSLDLACARNNVVGLY